MYSTLDLHLNLGPFHESLRNCLSHSISPQILLITGLLMFHLSDLQLLMPLGCLRNICKLQVGEFVRVQAAVSEHSTGTFPLLPFSRFGAEQFNILWRKKKPQCCTRLVSGVRKWSLKIYSGHTLVTSEGV